MHSAGKRPGDKSTKERALDGLKRARALTSPKGLRWIMLSYASGATLAMIIATRMPDSSGNAFSWQKCRNLLTAVVGA